MAQQTGIVSKESLGNDFKKREEEVKMLGSEIISLKNRHAKLLTLIEDAKMAEQKQFMME